MASKRERLSLDLKQYFSDTYKDLKTIQRFIKKSHQWIQDRQAEVKELKETVDSDKKTVDSDEKLDEKIVDSDEKLDEKIVDTDEKLGVVLEKTLSGLDDMKPFLDAVERLAVTSVPLCQALLAGADQQTVFLLLYTAQILSPLLLLFKLDNKKFFSPKVLNKAVFQTELLHYITAVRNMCDGWRNSPLNNASLNQPEVRLTHLSEEDIKNMLSMIHQLDTLRKDQNFRTVNLFDGKSQSFRKTFSEVKTHMLKLLEDLEACAQQLDSMNHGARISGTVSSSVGIVGGVMSIAGTIAAPFTAGLSLVLTAAGAGLGVTSGVQGIVTSATELGVNNTQTKKAKQAFDKCVTLMNELQHFLNDVIQQHFTSLQENKVWDTIEATYGGAVFAGCIAETFSLIFDPLTTVKVAADVVHNVGEGAVVGSKAGKVAADVVSDVADGAASISKAGCTASRTAKCVKIGTGVLNGAFVVVDGFFLYRDIKSLVDGTETEMSKWIRARAALWRTEIDSWQEVHDSLVKGEKVYEEYKALLQKPISPLN